MKAAIHCFERHGCLRLNRKVLLDKFCTYEVGHCTGKPRIHSSQSKL